MRYIIIFLTTLLFGKIAAGLNQLGGILKPMAILPIPSLKLKQVF